MNSRILPFVMGLLLLLSTASGAGQAGAGQKAEAPGSPEGKKGGTLTIGKVGEAPNLDPHMTSAIATRRVLDLVYSKLVMLNERMEAVPDLAESWDIPDAKTYVFHLRKNVKFHDGSPFTAEDVKFSFERIADPKGTSWGRAALDIIDKIEVIDQNTVKIFLKTPHAGFFAILGSDYACIVPKAVVQKHGHLRDIAVGTGPFKLAEWTTNVKTEFARNEFYYKSGLPHLDRIVMQIIPDELSAIAALKTKQVDMTRLQNARNYRLVSQPGLKLVETENLAYIYLGLNFKVKPLDDIRVRRAIALAINREGILRTVGMGRGSVLGPLAPGHTQFAVPIDQLAYNKQDVAEAKRLLKEAGYPDGFSTEIISPLPADYANIADSGVAVQAMLAQIGIKAELKQLELATYLNRTDRLKDAPMFMQMNSGRADPDDQLYSVFHSAGPLNRAFLNDAEVDRLLGLGRATLDPKERARVYKTLQLRLADQVPMVWLYCELQTDVMQDYVKGFLQNPMWTYRFLEQVWLDK